MKQEKSLDDDPFYAIALKACATAAEKAEKAAAAARAKAMAEAENAAAAMAEAGAAKTSADAQARTQERHSGPITQATSAAHFTTMPTVVEDVTLQSTSQTEQAQPPHVAQDVVRAESTIAQAHQSLQAIGDPGIPPAAEG